MYSFDGMHALSKQTRGGTKRVLLQKVQKQNLQIKFIVEIDKQAIKGTVPNKSIGK